MTTEESRTEERRTEEKRRLAIVVHGGAWAIPASIYQRSEQGAEQAALAGWQTLAAGGSAVDAVERAVRALEDDPVFDAGTGSVLNEDGDVEMDAIVVSGRGGVGAVAGVRRYPNPVSIARAVMDKTPHCLLIGEGAERLARREGFAAVASPDELVTEAARQEFADYVHYRRAVGALFNGEESGGGAGHDRTNSGEQLGHDTVGAVAIDGDGCLAAATSTGGITAKMAGRVGDSPLIGCGAFADNGLCAVSTTGHGESIIKTMLAREVGVVMQLHPDWPALRCVRAALDAMRDKTSGCGGVVCLTPAGDVAAAYTTPAMISCAVVDGVVSFPTRHEPGSTR